MRSSSNIHSDTATRSNGEAERMVQTMRNEIKAFKIQVGTISRITIKVKSPLLL